MKTRSPSDSIAPRHSNLFGATILSWCLLAAGATACALAKAAEERGVQVAIAAPPASATAASESTVAPRAAAAVASESEEGSAPALRLREGTQLSNQLGHFKQKGESVSFIDDQGRELGGLPNLNLERILRTLKSVEEPESVSWSVSGVVTEFAGRNYLLVSRAVYKAATATPAPDRLGE